MPFNSARSASASAMLRGSVLGLLILVGIVHFTVTLAFCLPATPVTLAAGPVMSKWLFPYFQQSWSFFAPSPPTKDDYVLVQYRYRSRNGELKESPWINLSKTYNTACQQNRLTPLEIVQLLISNAYSDSTRSELFQKGVLNEAVLKKEMAEGKLPPSFHTLERVGMAFFPEAGIEGTPVSLHLGFLHHEFPRFNHRYEPDPQDQNNTVVIFSYARFEQVAPL